MGQGHQLDAFRQLQVGQVNGLTHFNGSHVDFDEFRQVGRQAGNFDFHDGVGDFAALLLDANGGVLVDEVQRNVSGQLVVGDNADEVSVNHELLGRVTLQGLDQHGFHGVAEVQRDHVAEGSFVFQQLDHFVGLQADGQRSLVATVDYGRNQVGVTTQAAARTFPQVVTHFGVQSKFGHCISPE